MEKIEVKVVIHNKKGMIDIFYILAGLFCLSIIVFAVYMSIDKVHDSGIFTGYDDAEKVYAHGELSILSLDNIMMFIIVGLSLFLIISAVFIWNHPGFMIFGLLLLAIAIMVAGIVSNAWMDFTDQSEINEYTASFPKIHFLMQKLPFYIFFMGVAASIAMVVGYRRMY